MNEAQRGKNEDEKYDANVSPSPNMLVRAILSDKKKKGKKCIGKIL